MTKYIYHFGYLITFYKNVYIVHLDKTIHSTLTAAKERINFLTQ